MAGNHERILSFIATCADPKKLRSLIANADDRGEPGVADAARRRLFVVQAADRPGSLEFDVWQSIHALEESLSKERGTTTRLARTRQKIGRVGERQTVEDLTMGSSSSGFAMLIDRGWPELTFEALTLKHEDCFDAAVREKARERLSEAGVDVSAIPQRVGTGSGPE